LENRELSLNSVKKEIEDFSQRNLSLLHKYHNRIGQPSGIITPNTKSAERYIKLSEDMVLTVRRGKVIGLSKYGKILVNLAEREPSFDLNLREVSFFLKRIIEVDSAYFIPFILSLSNYRTLSDVSRNFRKNIISCFKTWFKHSSDQYLRKRIISTENWTNEKKYVENLVPPRLYWCFDLKIIDLKRNGKVTYDLSQVYYQLISKLSEIESPLRVKEWIDKNFYSTFAESYKCIYEQLSKKVQLFKNLPFSSKRNILVPRLENAFKEEERFPIPSKVLFSHFSEVTCTELLERGMVCEIHDIKDFVNELSRREEKYRLYWDPEVNDGFIRAL